MCRWHQHLALPGRLGAEGFPRCICRKLTFVHTVGSKGDSKCAIIVPAAITNKGPALDGLKIDLAMLRCRVAAICEFCRWGGGGPTNSGKKMRTGVNLENNVSGKIAHTVVSYGKCDTRLAAYTHTHIMRRKNKDNSKPEQDGRVVNAFTWGTGEGGQLGYGVDTPISQDVPRPAFPIGAVQGQHVVRAAAGGRHSLFLLESGEILASGVWDDGQLGCRGRPVVFPPGSAEEMMPVPKSLVPRGSETFPVPVQVPPKLVVKELSAGFASSFLVTDFGEVR